MKKDFDDKLIIKIMKFFIMIRFHSYTENIPKLWNLTDYYKYESDIIL